MGNSSSKAVKYWAIVPAAGIGRRMEADKPKQYLSLAGSTVIEHSLRCLQQVSVFEKIAVCIAEHDTYWAELAIAQSVLQVQGGSERCFSVLNGLRALSAYAQADDWILVHDAARPCVRVTDIQALIEQVSQHPVGGLLATAVRDTMKRADEQQQVAETVPRTDMWLALTPQMFRFQALKQALESALAHNILVTDEAQAMERQGKQPLLVAGHADNIKITHPQDLALAEVFLKILSP